MREYLRQLIQKALETQFEKYGYKNAKFDFSLESPPRTELGDYSTNAAFVLATLASESAVKVADEMRRVLISVKDVFEEINIAGGGFLNFKLSKEFLRKNFLKFEAKKTKSSNNKTVIIDYSSPNIGKPLSIAHIRSTIIGDALANIFKYLGWKVIRDNHLGDWGLQTGILIAAYKIWSKKPARTLSMEEMLELYVQYNTKMREHDELASKAKMETVLLQSGDKDTHNIWKTLWEKSVKDYARLYKILGVKFDYFLGESFYRKLFSEVIEEALKAGVAQRSEGAIVIPVGENQPPLIIQKNDGGYLYGTFDLATIKYRVLRWKPNLMLYVISNEQTLYLKQMLKAAEKLGWIKPNAAIHVKFGLMRGEDLKRLSTRAGKAILLENVLEEAIKKAREIVEEKNSKLSEREKTKISQLIGIGALKYNDLSQNRNTDIIFSWERMLDIHGQSAPYIQYTYARMRSIRRKIRNLKLKILNKPKILNELKQPEEIALMKKVLQFPEAVEDAAKEYLPNLLANYLWELANLANTFYEKHPVLKAEKELRSARLFLISKTADTIKTGLSLLGIEAPERI